MGKNEPRRLIKFGNSSYIVSLPIKWIEKNNLKKGDVLYLNEDGDSIQIAPKERKNDFVEQKKIIEVEGKTFDEINRRLISAYINNYSEIILKGKNDNLRKNMGRLMDKIGIEIIEQTQNELIIKDFLSVEGIALDKIIRRMDNMIRSIFEDLINGANEKRFKKEIYEDMCDVDKSINKIYFMVWKIIKRGQSAPSFFLEKLNLTQEELSNIQWLVLHMESVADEIKRVSRFLINENMKDKDFFLKIVGMIQKNYLDLMAEYYQKDPELALKIIIKKDEIIKLCNKFSDTSSFNKAGAISERLKTMTSSIHHISKIIAY